MPTMDEYIRSLLAEAGNAAGDSNFRHVPLDFIPQSWQALSDPQGVMEELLKYPAGEPYAGPRRGTPQAINVPYRPDSDKPFGMPTASPQAWMHGYPDPGDTTGRMTYSSTPEQQGYKMGADEAKQALQAYLDWYSQPLPKPGMTDEGKIQYDPNDMRMAELGMGAAGPLAAGLIRMGGKTYPNAYLHRAIGDPKELDWWGRLFQRGMSSEKPTSVVTPNVLQTFGSEPYGLVLNVPEEKAIKWASPVDAWSSKTRSVSDEALKRYANLSQIATEITGQPPMLESFMPSLKKASPFTHDELQRVRDEILNVPETWVPRLHSRAKQNSYPLDELFKDQAEAIARRKNVPFKGPAWLGHSEVIPEIDRSMLAGVRLPLRDADDYWHGAEKALGKNEQPPPPGLLEALRDFAQQMNVPIFRWPAQMTQAQQLKGLQDPFAGKWGYKPNSNREYITSSRLPQIFGITELP